MKTVRSAHPFPDAQGHPAKACAFRGGIAAFVDSAGNPVVEYRRDAWGKPTSTTGSLKTLLRELNPFRYRGYVHDEEIGLYYLEKRYYYPERERFINSDMVFIFTATNSEELLNQNFLHIAEIIRLWSMTPLVFGVGKLSSKQRRQ